MPQMLCIPQLALGSTGSPEQEHFGGVPAVPESGESTVAQEH